MKRQSSTDSAARLRLSAAVIAVLLGACDRSTSSTSAVKPAVSTDLGKLRALVSVPPDVISARWLVRPLRDEGSRLVPGPTDTILIAYLETSPTFWREQGHLFAETKGPVQRIRAADAEALLPAAVLAKATFSPGEYQLHCIRVSPKALSSATNRATGALHCGTGLLLSFASQ